MNAWLGPPFPDLSICFFLGKQGISFVSIHSRMYRLITTSRHRGMSHRVVCRDLPTLHQVTQDLPNGSVLLLVHDHVSLYLRNCEKRVEESRNGTGSRGTQFAVHQNIAHGIRWEVFNWNMSATSNLPSHRTKCRKSEF